MFGRVVPLNFVKKLDKTVNIQIKVTKIEVWERETNIKLQFWF